MTTKTEALKQARKVLESAGILAGLAEKCKAAIAMIDAALAEPEWVELSDKQPTEGQKVWVCSHEWEDEANPLFVAPAIFVDGDFPSDNEEDATYYCKWWMPRNEMTPPAAPSKAPQ